MWQLEVNSTTDTPVPHLVRRQIDRWRVNGGVRGRGVRIRGRRRERVNKRERYHRLWMIKMTTTSAKKQENVTELIYASTHPSLSWKDLGVCMTAVSGSMCRG